MTSTLPSCLRVRSPNGSAPSGSRGLREITSELLVELHDSNAEEAASGFAEPATTAGDLTAPAKASAAAGQFSRWKALRRSHFAAADEIVEHVQALRSEWDRR